MAGADRLGSASAFVRAVTDFIFVEDAPAPADVILVPGSAHPEHVLRAAALYRGGYAPWMLPSGRYSIKTGRFAGVPAAYQGRFGGDYETEWAYMRAILLAEGVPEYAVLREDQATFTWENAQLSRRALEEKGVAVRRAILCCRAFHARRALLYYQAAFPEAELRVCPARTPGADRDDWFLTPAGRERVLGEVSRCGSQVGQVLADFLAREEKAAADR